MNEKRKFKRFSERWIGLAVGVRCSVLDRPQLSLTSLQFTQIFVQFCGMDELTELEETIQNLAKRCKVTTTINFTKLNCRLEVFSIAKNNSHKKHECQSCKCSKKFHRNKLPWPILAVFNFTSQNTKINQILAKNTTKNITRL